METLPCCPQRCGTRRRVRRRPRGRSALPAAWPSPPCSGAAAHSAAVLRVVQAIPGGRGALAGHRASQPSGLRERNRRLQDQQPESGHLQALQPLPWATWRRPTSHAHEERGWSTPAGGPTRQAAGLWLEPAAAHTWLPQSRPGGRCALQSTRCPQTRRAWRAPAARALRERLECSSCVCRAGADARQVGPRPPKRACFRRGERSCSTHHAVAAPAGGRQLRSVQLHIGCLVVCRQLHRAPADPQPLRGAGHLGPEAHQLLLRGRVACTAASSCHVFPPLGRTSQLHGAGGCLRRLLVCLGRRCCRWQRRCLRCSRHWMCRLFGRHAFAARKATAAPTTAELAQSCSPLLAPRPGLVIVKDRSNARVLPAAAIQKGSGLAGSAACMACKLSLPDCDTSDQMISYEKDAWRQPVPLTLLVLFPWHSRCCCQCCLPQRNAGSCKGAAKADSIPKDSTVCNQICSRSKLPPLRCRLCCCSLRFASRLRLCLCLCIIIVCQHQARHNALVVLSQSICMSKVADPQRAAGACRDASSALAVATF